MVVPEEHQAIASTEQRIRLWPVRTMSTSSNPEVRAGSATDVHTLVASLKGDEFQKMDVGDTASLDHAVLCYADIERAPLRRSSSMTDLPIANGWSEQPPTTDGSNIRSPTDGHRRRSLADGMPTSFEIQDEAGLDTATWRRSLPPLRLWIHDNADISTSMPASKGGITGSALVGIATTPNTHTVPNHSPNSSAELRIQSEGVQNQAGRAVPMKTSVYKVSWEEPNWPELESGSADSSSSPDCDGGSEDFYKFVRSDTPWVGLERVNTKLAAWSWSGESRGGVVQRNSRGSLRSGIARPMFDHVLEDNEDDEDDMDDEHDNGDQNPLGAPPNSNMPSQRSSRQPSCPPSGRKACDTTSHSDEEDQDLKVQHAKDSLTVSGQAMGGMGGHALRSSSGRRKIAKLARVLSNLPVDEAHFTGHRDSVALAHQRIVQVAAHSPIIFRQRDSIALVKERIKNRPACSSMPRDIPRKSHVRFGDLSPIADSSV